MTTRNKPIHEYMTPLPHTIGADQTLESAALRMAQLGARHLPVLEGGVLVGVLSERDIAFVRSLRSIDPDRTTVDEAMTPEPYVVGPEMPVAAVARTMADKKVGCAIVVDHGSVIGIWTTTDALSLLANLFALGVPPRTTGLLPSEVRQRILDEHRIVRRMIDEAERLAERVLADDRDAEPELFSQARELYQTLVRHLDLEDAILAPALRETGDAYGSARADALEKDHDEQRHQLRRALADAEEGAASRLARAIQLLVPHLRKDLEHEEKDLLNAGLLEDGVVRSDIFTG
jgi:acetoin utilization protein AcuB